MELNLTPEQEKFALECIQSGRCQNIHDLLDFAFQLLEEYESKTPTEKFALFLSRLPYVSDEEQKDIEEHFGSLPNYDRSEYVDRTDWLLGKKEL